MKGSKKVMSKKENNNVKNDDKKMFPSAQINWLITIYLNL